MSPRLHLSPVRNIAVPITPLLLLLSLFLLLPPTALADDLGFFASRRVLSDADSALASGKLDTASELYTRVVEGTEADNGRHVRALLGAAVAELGQEEGDVEAARRHLEAYLGSYEAEQKGVARVLVRLLDEATSTGGQPTASQSDPPPVPAPAGPARAEDAERIAALERQLAEAQRSIAEKEKLIEELREIVVDGGG